MLLIGVAIVLSMVVVFQRPLFIPQVWLRKSI
jgi:hypothetical protein